MTKITCDICMDLIPLVQDGVASPDSEKAVLEHVKECESCGAVFNPTEPKPTPDEAKIRSKIKKRLRIAALILIGAGVLFGVGLSMKQAMFYNVNIMPIIGAAGYVVLKKKSYLVPLSVFAVSFVWFLISFLGTGHFDIYSIPASIQWSLIYTALCAVGTLVAFLLHFAFKKEDK